MKLCLKKDGGGFTSKTSKLFETYKTKWSLRALLVPTAPQPHLYHTESSEGKVKTTLAQVSGDQGQGLAGRKVTWDYTPGELHLQDARKIFYLS